MAQQIRLVDDTDRKTEAVETVTFAVRGRNYEIDLSAENVAEFDRQMEFWVEHARKAGKPPATVHVAKPTNTTAAKKIAQKRPEEWSDPVGASHEEKAQYRQMRRDARDWALANGWPHLGDLGRVPVEAYAAWKEHMGWRGDVFACWSNHQRKKSAPTTGRTNGHLVRV